MRSEIESDIFLDKAGRRIELVCEPPDVAAYCQGVMVGRFEFAPQAPGGPPMLAHMNVREEFRRAGIGTALLAFALRTMPPFFAPGLCCSPRHSRFYYHQPGRAFILACLERGVIDHGQLCES